MGGAERQSQDGVRQLLAPVPDLRDRAFEEGDRLVELPAREREPRPSYRQRVVERRRVQAGDHVGGPVEQLGAVPVARHVEGLQESPGQRDQPSSRVERRHGLVEGTHGGGPVTGPFGHLRPQQLGAGTELTVTDTVEQLDGRRDLRGRGHQRSDVQVGSRLGEPREGLVVRHPQTDRDLDGLLGLLDRLLVEARGQVDARLLRPDPQHLGVDAEARQLRAGDVQHRHRVHQLAQVLMGVGEVHRALGGPQQVPRGLELVHGPPQRVARISRSSEGQELDPLVGALLRDLRTHPDRVVDGLGLDVGGQRPGMFAEEAVAHPEVAERGGPDGGDAVRVGLRRGDGRQLGQQVVADRDGALVIAQVVEHLHPAEVGADRRETASCQLVAHPGGGDQGEGGGQVAGLGPHPGQEVLHPRGHHRETQLLGGGQGHLGEGDGSTRRGVHTGLDVVRQQVEPVLVEPGGHAHRRQPSGERRGPQQGLGDVGGRCAHGHVNG